MNNLDLFKQYLAFLEIKNKSENNININQNFIGIVTFILLSQYYEENKNKKIIASHNVFNYFKIMNTTNNFNSEKTYIPYIDLPKKPEKGNLLLKKIYTYTKDGKDLGGESVFKNLINELIDNIYQHSYFTKSKISAQKYGKLKFCDICFLDNGITISGSFDLKKYNYSTPCDAILQAMNGKSTKSKNRGWGLYSNIKIYTQNLKGELLIVSGSGAVYKNKNSTNLYILKNTNYLKGTLIVFRIPYPSKSLDLLQVYLKF